jgi:phosphoribosylamine--glycine ligase
MKVLIVGGGGREHALAWKAAQSPRVETVLVAPGNAGTAREAGVRNVPVKADDIEGLVRLAREQEVALTIVGPEAPLVAGITDAFHTAGLACFGPTAAGARLEGSKAFAKDFMRRHRIPTAVHAAFDDADEAVAWIRERDRPLVVKADGLAAGKGVTVCDSGAEAETAVRRMLDEGAFGDAGARVVVEDRLEGEEASYMVLAAGTEALEFASSQDHKPRDEGDTGPNTGGMGAYSPAPVVDEQVHARILDRIMRPTLQGLALDGIPYHGFLYAGLMISPDGEPRVLEFNCRLGDPETEPLLMRLDSDLVELIQAALDDELDSVSAQWNPRTALGVVMAAGGYPGNYEKGLRIRGLDSQDPPDTKVFHAGTAEQDGRLVTSGGRVLCVCALGDSVAEAQNRAYERVETIDWKDVHYRKDIGFRALRREESS